MPYEIKVGQFTGPLDALLELVESRELPISEVSLAAVTDDFLRFLQELKNAEERNPEMETSNLRILADFVAVASRLIFLKSKLLLPDFVLTGEEEGEIKDLEERLRLYRDLKPAMKLVAELWRSHRKEFSRPYFFHVDLAHNLRQREGRFFYPGENLTRTRLRQSLEEIVNTFQGIELETKTLKETIVSIEEKMQEIVRRLKNVAEMKFQTLSRAKPATEIIAMFLAILHLAREHAVLLEQHSAFSDIIIKHPKSVKS